MTADLTSTRFDSRTSAGSSGLPPGERDSARRRPNNSRKNADAGCHIECCPISLELAKLREHDADVKFRGTSVKWARYRWTISSLT
jgi:hypothetical protein